MQARDSASRRAIIQLDQLHPNMKREVAYFFYHMLGQSGDGAHSRRDRSQRAAGRSGHRARDGCHGVGAGLARTDRTPCAQSGTTAKLGRCRSIHNSARWHGRLVTSVVRTAPAYAIAA